MEKSVSIALLIILISFAIGTYLYPLMPDRIASHWNSKGEVDGYMDRFWGLFLMPIVSFFLLILFILIPKIDPLKENIAEFRKYYDGFVALILLFLFYIYLLTVLWNIGKSFNMTRAIAPSLGILFYYLGILLENAKRNWFIGIRTPWTLSNEKVWNKTHRIGAKLFKTAGIITLLGFFFPGFAIILVIVPALLVTIFTVVYSYFEYQKETNQTS